MLCVLLLAPTASIAAAAPGVDLRWTDCPGEADAVQSKTFACTSNTGSRTLVGSFQLGADLLRTSGIEVAVDIATAGCGPACPVEWEGRSVANPLPPIPISCLLISVTITGADGAAGSRGDDVSIASADPAVA